VTTLEHRALTVRQPWASAILLGGKDVENRTKPPPKGLVGQRLWIHAGLKLELEGLVFCRRLGFDPLGFGKGDIDRGSVRQRQRQMRAFDHGAILGSVLLVGVETMNASPWRITEKDGRDYPYAWILADPRPLVTPVSCVGSISLGWRVPEAVVERLLEQGRGAA
jgi:hypothetical protein